MPIPNFSDLLNDVLNGEIKAINKWIVYSINHSFDEQEIKQTLQKINDCSSNNGPQKSNALFLKASGYIHGIGSDKNYPEAIKLLEDAIKLDNSTAMTHRAFMHMNGMGGDKNYPETIRLLEKAIILGDYRAMTHRAFMHMNGIGGDKNYPETIRLLEEVITLDDSSAMTNRAFMHMNGIGGDKNYPEAIRLYEKAIILDDSNAMINRARMHEEGLGGDKNYPEAIRLLEEAIKLGNSYAMYHRAIIHKNGLGGDKNSPEAIRLLEKASKLGDAAARNKLDRLRQEQEKETRDLLINSTKNKIDRALGTLEQKIDDIEGPHKATATQLFSDLKEAKQEYLTNLNNLDLRILDANDRFEGKCDALVNEAKPVLERELGWEDYLTNLLKTIVNAIIWTITFGKVGTFFTPTRAESVLAVEEALPQLRPE